MTLPIFYLYKNIGAETLHVHSHIRVTLRILPLQKNRLLFCRQLLAAECRVTAISMLPVSWERHRCLLGRAFISAEY
jgi:hypothetical protein